AEVALACLLLVGSGLVVRSLRTLLTWSPGFSGQDLHLAFTTLAVEDYPDNAAAAAGFARVLEEVRRTPGVESASLASGGPLFGGRELDQFSATEGPSAGDTVTVRWFDASPGHLRNLGLRLLAGRDLAPDDRLGAPRVAVVNQRFVRRLLGEGNPVGRHARRRRDGADFTVVGVVADVPPLNPDDQAEPEIYWPLDQEPRWGSVLVVRTRGGATVPAEARTRVAALERGVSINQFRPYQAGIDRELVSPRFNVLLLGSFAIVALGIALAGVYGLMRYLIALGARDSAIRLALGATPSRLRRWTLGRGMVPVALGLGIGLILAAALSRLMVGLLVGVRPTNPATYLGVGVALAAMALLATWLPVRRIGRDSAMSLLRTE
ncbi:MAG TPA: ABC transporter permease, partial [Gemmatimonadales bacterium]|nr:ABC transporter permease [Gemmatimonadales bacterium]